MKRRIRLMSAILSLAASMAVLVFGVYAAVEAKTASVSSEISFESTTLRAQVAVKHIPPQNDISTTVNQALFDNTAVITNISPNTISQANLNAGTATAVSITEQKFTENALNYAIIISIKNNYTANVSIKVTAPAAPSGPNGIAITRYGSSTITSNQMTIGPDSTGYIMYHYVLTLAQTSGFAKTTIEYNSFSISLA